MVQGEDQLIAKSENPDMRNDEVITAIAPIDLQAKREEEQRIKMSWVSIIMSHKSLPNSIPGCLARSVINPSLQ
jgi:hypothetical protein